MIYAGLGGPAEFHRHHAVQLVVSFDEPFEVDVEGQRVTARAGRRPGRGAVRGGDRAAGWSFWSWPALTDRLAPGLRSDRWS